MVETNMRKTPQQMAAQVYQEDDLIKEFIAGIKYLSDEELVMEYIIDSDYVIIRNAYMKEILLRIFRKVVLHDSIGKM